MHDKGRTSNRRRNSPVLELWTIEQNLAQYVATYYAKFCSWDRHLYVYKDEMLCCFAPATHKRCPQPARDIMGRWIWNVVRPPFGPADLLGIVISKRTDTQQKLYLRTFQDHRLGTRSISGERAIGANGDGDKLTQAPNITIGSVFPSDFKQSIVCNSG